MTVAHRTACPHGPPRGRRAFVRRPRLAATPADSRSLGAALVLAVLLGGLPVRADTVVTSVEIDCDLPRCRRQSEMDRLLSLTDLAVGKRYETEMGEAAAYFLEQTGLFEEGSVRLVETPTDDGVDVRFETEGRTYIREVDIEAGLSLESEVRQRLFMRPGVAYEPERTQSQIESIEAIFERDGYYDTHVQIVAVEVEPYLVDLAVIVDKGPRLDVRDVYLRGHEAFSYDELRSILLGEFGFFRTFTAEDFESGLDEILDRYRDAGYLRARFPTERAVPHPDEGAVDLFVEIREGPRWTFAFAGNRQFDRDDLMELLPFAATGYVDEAEVQASAEEIEAFYRAAGYFFVDVSVRQESLGESETRVMYTVFEGPQAEVRRVDFEGNENIPDGELRGLMTTQEYGLLETGGYLQSEQLEADIRAIQAHYHELGYLSAFVPRWTVVAEDGGRSLFVTLFIEEGPQTLVGEIRYRGNTILSDRELRRGLRLHAGDPLDLTLLGADETTVLNRYLALGQRPRKSEAVCYEGDVAMRCALPQFPRGCLRFDPSQCVERRRGDRIVRECPRLSQTLGCEMTGGITDPEVDIEYRVAEGDLVRVGEIFVIGNFSTNQNVIRRELGLRPGDPYDPTALLEGQANLRSLGLFNSVRVNTIGVGERAQYARNTAAIVVNVEEAPTRFIEYRVGLASQNSASNDFRVVFQNEIGFIDQNFVGRALGLQLIGSFDFDLVGAARVAEGDFAAGAAAIFTDPRFNWFGLADDPWEARVQATYTYDLLSNTLDEISYAGDLQFRQEFAAVDGLYFTLTATIKRAETKDPEETAFEPPRLVIGLSPSLTLDRRNNPLNPTRGYLAEVAVSLADKFFGRAVDTEQFTKIRLTASYLWPFGEHFVLGSHLRFGFTLGGLFNGFRRPELSSDAPEDRRILPDFEGFRLGGVSGLRGFPDNTIGPAGPEGGPTWGDVVLNGTFELRYPIFPAADFFGAAFVDWGQLTAEFSDLTWDGFRFSTGLGIRWLAFGLVPVVLDYGLVLGRRPGESIGQLHFNVGYTF